MLPAGCSRLPGSHSDPLAAGASSSSLCQLQADAHQYQLQAHAHQYQLQANAHQYQLQAEPADRASADAAKTLDTALPAGNSSVFSMPTCRSAAPARSAAAGTHRRVGRGTAPGAASQTLLCLRRALRVQNWSRSGASPPALPDVRLHWRARSVMEHCRTTKADGSHEFAAHSCSEGPGGPTMARFQQQFIKAGMQAAADAASKQTCAHLG